MNNQQHTVRISIDVPDSEHRKLKAIAALRGVSMKQIILEYISKEVYSDNIPNDETLKVFQEADEGKNVNYYGSIDLFKKLGIDHA